MSCCGPDMQRFAAEADAYSLMDALVDMFLLDFADDASVVDREAVCAECESRFAPFDTCMVCGCPLPFRRQFRRAPCPVGKWPLLQK